VLPYGHTTLLQVQVALVFVPASFRSMTSGMLAETENGDDVLSSLSISRGCVPGNRDLNRKLVDTVIYLPFVTKFSFSFQIWHIYIYNL
jgi:hypothetical protein